MFQRNCFIVSFWGVILVDSLRSSTIIESAATEINWPNGEIPKILILTPNSLTDHPAWAMLLPLLCLGFDGTQSTLSIPHLFKRILTL